MSIDHDPRTATAPGCDPDDVSSNPSGNRPFHDVLAARVSRRDVVRGGTVIGAAAFVGVLVNVPRWVRVNVLRC
jgi:hypothetical protein